MCPLEGKEIEGKIGDMGDYSLDVDDKGNLTIEAGINKDFGLATVGSSLSVKTNVLKIAEEIAKKTSTIWDDEAIAALEKLLGISK